MKELTEILDNDAISSTGSAGGLGVPPAASRTRAITVLVNNSDYLSWFFDSLGRSMLRAAHDLSPINPMKIGVIAMAKFIRHPNAWKLFVHQIAELDDATFDRYWPDVAKLVKEIDGD